MRKLVGRGMVVATLALAMAGCGGSGGGSSYKEPAGPAVATLKVSAGNQWFKPKHLSSPAGIVEIRLRNTESGVHTLVIQDVPGFKLQVSGSGATDASKVELKQGKHTFYCSIPGHRELGMEGTLTVR